MLLLLIGTHAQALTIRVLAIGNSFSEDAAEHYLARIAQANGDTLIIGNLFIAGCSLERHWQNAEENADAYDYRKIDASGTKTETRKTAMATALADDDWDYITFQQVSHLSGQYDTYFPYLEQLVDYVKAHATNPDLKLALHMTWAYAQKCNHFGFANYDKDQLTMYRAIVETVRQAAQEVGITYIIPAGTAVQNGRTSSIGDNFCRDGFHLNFGIGRYTASCAWYEFLTQHSVIDNTFQPEGLSAEEIRIAQEAAHAATIHPFCMTKIDVPTGK